MRFNYLAFGLYGAVVLREPPHPHTDFYTFTIRRVNRLGAWAFLSFLLTPYPPIDSISGLFVSWYPHLSFEVGALRRDGSFDADTAWKHSDVAMEVVEEMLSAKRRVPDPVDAALLFNSFLSYTLPWKRLKLPLKIAREIGVYDSKRLSWHFNAHLRPYWIWNSFTPFPDLSTAPQLLFILRGKDAARVVAAFSVFYPYGFGVIGEQKSALLINLPCPLMPGFFDVLSRAKVEGEYWLVEPALRREVPRFWRALKRDGRYYVWRRMEAVVNAGH